MALVIVGHGSTLNPDSSEPTHLHADTIRRLGIFDQVVCAFWKEEPSMREVFTTVDADTVYVVPNFISEGYFTRDVLPRELQLDGPVTKRGKRTIYYCDPVGIHPTMTELLLKRAAEVAPGVAPAESSLIIVGHGTGLNDNSTKAIKDQVTAIADSGLGFAEVLDAYMEEPPLISDWVKLTTAPNVIVVPFFIADGLHSFQDIPVMLGVETEPTAAASQLEVFRRNPYDLADRKLFYSGAIGTEPLLAKVILEQIVAFDAQHGISQESTAKTEHKLLAGLLGWLLEGNTQFGEVAISAPPGGGFALQHVAEDGVNLQEHKGSEAAREIARLSADGSFRPVKTAPTLRKGWRLVLEGPEELLTALDFLYPGAVGVTLAVHAGELQATPLAAFFGRQTGMYRITGLAQHEETRVVAAETCGAGKCARRCLWQWSEDAALGSFSGEKGRVAESLGQSWPMYCVEPCPLLVGEVRGAIKKRLAAKA